MNGRRYVDQSLATGDMAESARRAATVAEEHRLACMEAEKAGETLEAKAHEILARLWEQEADKYLAQAKVKG